MDKSLKIYNIIKIPKNIRNKAEMCNIYCQLFARIRSKIKVNDKILYILEFLEGLDNNSRLSCHPNNIKKTHKGNIIFSSFLDEKYILNKDWDIPYEKHIKICKISKKLKKKYKMMVNKQLRKKVDSTIKKILLKKKIFRLWKKNINSIKINNEFNSKIIENYLESGISKDYFCPISKVIFKEPVILGSKNKPNIGGNTYEKEFISEWLKRGHKTDPLTNISIDNPILIRNNLVINQIKSFKEEFRFKLDKEGVKPCYFKN